MHWEYEEEILLIALFNYSKLHNNEEVEVAIKGLSELLVDRAKKLGLSSRHRTYEEIKIKFEQLSNQAMYGSADDYEESSHLYDRSVKHPFEFANRVAQIKEKLSIIGLAKPDIITQQIKKYNNSKYTYGEIYGMIPEDYHSFTIDNLFSNRTYYALKRSNINTIGNILSMTPNEPKLTKDIGKYCINEIEPYLETIKSNVQDNDMSSFSKAEDLELKKHNLLDLLNHMLDGRSDKIAFNYVSIYPVADHVKEMLLSMCRNSKMTIRDLVYRCISAEQELDILHYFINWCSCDVNLKIKNIFDFVYKKDRTRFIIESRCLGYYKKSIGDALGLSTERVRQIDQNAIRIFKQLIKRNKILELISAQQNGDPVIHEESLSQYFGDYTKAAIYMFRNINAQDEKYKIHRETNDRKVYISFSKTKIIKSL